MFFSSIMRFDTQGTVSVLPDPISALKMAKNAFFHLEKIQKVHFSCFLLLFHTDSSVYICQMFMQMITQLSKQDWTTFGPFRLI